MPMQDLEKASNSITTIRRSMKKYLPLANKMAVRFIKIIFIYINITKLSPKL